MGVISQSISEFAEPLGSTRRRSRPIQLHKQSKQATTLTNSIIRREVRALHTKSEPLRSRYRIHVDGLETVVDGGVGRAPVLIQLQPYDRPNHLLVSMPYDRDYQARLGLMEFHYLLHEVAECLMSEWQADADRDPQVQWHAGTWARKQTRIAIATRLKEAWQALLGHVAPLVFQTQTRVFSATGCMSPSPDVLKDPHFYEDRDLISDIVEYRGAAAAVGLETWYGYRFLGAGNHYTSVSSEQMHEGLRRWRDYLSPSGHSYFELNESLNHWPGGVPYGLLRGFADITLTRPVIDRLEVVWLLLSAACGATGPAFTNASRRDILWAMDAIGAVSMLPKSRASRRQPASIADCRNSVEFLNGRCPVHLRPSGDLRTVVDVVCQEEVRRNIETVQAAVAQVGPYTAAPVPPIPLPRSSSIRFLSTAADIGHALLDANSCSTWLLDAAVTRQSCYLFEVSEGAETVLVTVNTEGHIDAIEARQTGTGSLADRALRLLHRWARPLRQRGQEQCQHHDEVADEARPFSTLNTTTQEA